MASPSNNQLNALHVMLMVFVTLVCLLMLGQVVSSYLHLVEVNAQLGRSNGNMEHDWTQILILGSLSCLFVGLTVFVYRKIKEK